jgi:Uncharacterized conserved protein (COG2071)
MIPFHRLKRHPFPIRAFFRNSLVLTYALPREMLQPMLPPGLILDTLGELGFFAIAMVQTEALRPAGFHRLFSQDFFLSGYRIFTRFQTSDGRKLRGLRILRSDTNRRLMVLFGNLLTHYAYRHAAVAFSEEKDRLEIEITTPNAEADLHVVAQIDTDALQLPQGSPFADFHQARLFAGPLPFTFDYETETNAIVMIEGVRTEWKPKPVRVDILKNTFFQHGPFRGTSPILANAFHVQNVEYLWRRGVRVELPQD